MFILDFFCSLILFLYHHAGKWLGNRQIRCNWATKGAGLNDDKQNSDAKSVVELTNGTSGECLYKRCFDSVEAEAAEQLMI